MNRVPSSPPPAREPRRLLTPEQTRSLLTRTDPAYGQVFSEAEWSTIAERLSALARLLWRISERRAAVTPVADPERPPRQRDHPKADEGTP